jgi:hypothetical protein
LSAIAAGAIARAAAIARNANVKFFTVPPGMLLWALVSVLGESILCTRSNLCAKAILFIFNDLQTKELKM